MIDRQLMFDITARLHKTPSVLTPDTSSNTLSSTLSQYITETWLRSTSRVHFLFFLMTFINLLFFPTSVVFGLRREVGGNIFTGLCVQNTWCSTFLKSFIWRWRFISVWMCPLWPCGYQTVSLLTLQTGKHTSSSTTKVALDPPEDSDWIVLSAQ